MSRCLLKCWRPTFLVSQILTGNFGQMSCKLNPYKYFILKESCIIFESIPFRFYFIFYHAVLKFVR